MANRYRTLSGDVNLDGGAADTSRDLQDIAAPSPASNSRVKTLNEAADPDHNERRRSQNNPIGPDDLNFENLSLHDAGSRFVAEASHRYGHHHHRGSRGYGDFRPFNTPPRDHSRRDSNARSSASYHGRGGHGGFRNSRTWVSPDTQAQQEFLVIRNSMRRLFKASDVASWKLNNYLGHRQAMIAAEAYKLANQVDIKEKNRTVLPTSIPPETQYDLRKWGLEGNFEQHGNYGRVLGEQTIWCMDWLNGKDEVAPWPTLAEMKWEGDDRAKTGVGRFLPLPREEGPPSLPWNQLPVVEQYPFDQIAKIPTMEDVYLPVDDQIEEDKMYLWDTQLEAAMDELLDT